MAQSCIHTNTCRYNRRTEDRTLTDTLSLSRSHTYIHIHLYTHIHTHTHVNKHTHKTRLHTTKLPCNTFRTHMPTSPLLPLAIPSPLLAYRRPPPFPPLPSTLMPSHSNKQPTSHSMQVYVTPIQTCTGQSTHLDRPSPAQTYRPSGRLTPLPPHSMPRPAPPCPLLPLCLSMLEPPLPPRADAMPPAPTCPPPSQRHPSGSHPPIAYTDRWPLPTVSTLELGLKDRARDPIDRGWPGKAPRVGEAWVGQLRHVPGREKEGVHAC